MKARERVEIAAIIDNKLKEIVLEKKKLAEMCRPIAPDNAIGRLSRMEAINEKSVNEAALNLLKIKERKLLKAQEKVLEEDFGICLECEEEIPLKRMKLLPESIVCVNCLNEASEN
jgi:DnaK suppressor protein